jgi:hypothetical protein
MGKEQFCQSDQLDGNLLILRTLNGFNHWLLQCKAKRRRPSCFIAAIFCITG